MKKILISGYYGFSNIGDEAVLSAIIHELKETLPGVSIRVLSASPPSTAAAHGVETSDRWKLREIVSAIRKTDVFVSGGGSLLQDATGSRSILYYLGLIRLARLFRKKVFIYAQGIGPFYAEKSRRRALRVLKRCSAVTLRDEDSARLLIAGGVKAEKIAVTCDPVLGRQPGDAAPPLPAGLKMAFALRSWRDVSVKTIAEVADHFAAIGYKIIYLPFCDPDDLLISRLTAGAMTRESYIIEESLSCDEMLSVISSCQMVIGMRLHSLIMAAACGVPFAGISYDPKIDSFCQDTNQPVIGTSGEKDAKKLIAAAERAIARKGESRRFLTSKKHLWQELCRANAIMLREYAFGGKNFSPRDYLP